MWTGALVRRQFVDDLDARQRVGQLFATAFAAGMLGDDDGLVLSGAGFLRLNFGFIEQADLIRRDLLAAGGIASRQGKVELFRKAENLCLVMLVLSGELFVTRKLISDQ